MISTAPTTTLAITTGKSRWAESSTRRPRPGQEKTTSKKVPADQAGEEAPKPVQTGRKALRSTCPHITIRCARPLA